MGCDLCVYNFNDVVSHYITRASMMIMNDDNNILSVLLFFLLFYYWLFYLYFIWNYYYYLYYYLYIIIYYFYYDDDGPMAFIRRIIEINNNAKACSSNWPELLHYTQQCRYYYDNGILAVISTSCPPACLRPLTSKKPVKEKTPSITMGIAFGTMLSQYYRVQ